MLTQERLKYLLAYDESTGLFRWKYGFKSQVKPGSIAGTRVRNGYIKIRVDKQKYLAHRLAWLWLHGAMPGDQLDHINGVRDDNKRCNLREATQAQNSQNLKRKKNNKSGFTGVSKVEGYEQWRAQIRANGKVVRIGQFDTPELASEAYLSAKSSLHTFHPAPRNT